MDRGVEVGRRRGGEFVSRLFDRLVAPRLPLFDRLGRGLDAHVRTLDRAPVVFTHHALHRGT